MPNDDLQIAYDDAVFAFTQGDYTSAIEQFETILGMAHYRLDDYKRAIAEGHKAEELDPKEQRVHTNLSLFYMKNGDKEKAEHHGLQARIAGWRGNMDASETGDNSLKMAGTEPEPIRLPTKITDMPWKKNKEK